MTATVTKLPTSSAPAHLSAEAKVWWKKLRDEYSSDDEAGRLLLQVALEAFMPIKYRHQRRSRKPKGPGAINLLLVLWRPLDGLTR